MVFRIDDKWTWDFWFAEVERELHVFYLQAPKSLNDEQRRHRHATIGHAKSRNLLDWEVLPDPLGLGRLGEFDDLATWTGSVLRGPHQWYLFYTGISTRDDGQVQRIGVATSTDLVTFVRSGRPPLVADPQWYELLAGSTEGEESWRDPWVFEDPNEMGTFHMLLTARVKYGPGDGRGVIAHATSRDLLEWTARAPLTEPGQLVGLEVPSLHYIAGRWRLFYCTHARWASEVRRRTSHAALETGTYYLTGDSPLGPFREGDKSLLLGKPYYAGRVIYWDNTWYLMAFVGSLTDGVFRGEISSPMPLEVSASGELIVTPPNDVVMATSSGQTL